MKKDISIIVPVYNAEKYIVETLESVVSQMTSKVHFEVLLIDDHSTDGSAEIINDYILKYPEMFKYYVNDKKGVSSARNFGINIATSRYLMFLDSDDILEENSIENLVRFFDANYDKTDIIVYPIFNYYEDIITDETGLEIEKKVRKVSHFRNRHFTKKSAIYNVNDFYQISQTTMNVVVKNLHLEKILFNENLHFAEDALFNTQYVMRKQTLGFCAEAKYFYRQSHFSSANLNASPVKSANSLIHYAETQFEPYQGIPVPRYVQFIVAYELRWRLNSAVNAVFPFHFSKRDFTDWENQLADVVRRIDDDLIFELPLDRYHKYRFLLLKQDYLAFSQKDNRIDIYHNGNFIGKEKNFETVVTDIRVVDKKFFFSAYLKTPAQEMLDFRVIVSINGVKKEIPTYTSTFSFYRKRYQFTEFIGYKFEVDLDSVYEHKKIEFLYVLNGVEHKIKKLKFERNRLWNVVDKKFLPTFVNLKKISLSKNFKIEISPITSEEEAEGNRDKTSTISKRDSKASMLRTYGISHQKDKVWLYSDRINVFDNGIYQFIHDFSKDDGIERYYIYEGDLNQVIQHCPDIPQKNLVKYGSDEHKKLYMIAEYLLCSFQGYLEINPFSKAEYNLVKDQIKLKFVYLQHGILHAHTPWIYSKERTYIDKFVVSSEFEKENLVNNYLYDAEDIIEGGMPRFELSESTVNKNGKVLFAPSWRNSLIKQKVGNNWIVDENRAWASDYVTGIISLTENETLLELLKQNNLQIDIKLHPIFEDLIPALENKINTPEISIVKGSVNSDEYSVFVTDFSSFVFDAAYVQTPIIYYVPDFSYFTAGNHSYTKLDLDLSEGFGEFTQTPNEFYVALKKIIQNGFIPDHLYKKRMVDFFSVTKKPMENLYQELMKESKYNEK